MGRQIHYLSAFVVGIVSICPPVAGALHTFQPNCSLPAAGQQYWFVAGANVRGSWQLVWTCLFTLFVCSYQVVHMNIPPSSKDKENGKWPLWKSWWWALVAVLMPELILIDSWSALRQAREDLEAQSSLNEDTKQPWTLTHVFYANMGGLVIPSKDGNLTITGNWIPMACRRHILHPEPPIPLAEINEKSQDDAFSRTIAVSQIIFFYVQIFARVHQGLAISQLELGVVSIAAYSFVSYLCLWHKPKGISHPTVISLDDVGLQEVDALVADADGTYYRQLLAQRIWSLGTAFGHSSGSSGGAMNTIWMLLAIMPLGIIHLAGWNFDFPTSVHKWLWRAASVIVTAFPISLLWMGINAVMCESIKVLFRSFAASMVVMSAIFLLARVVLIMEMFRCVFFLPSSAFEVANWTQSIPHFG